MIACVRIPYFAAATERRDNRKLHSKPLVIGGQHWSYAPVYAPSLETARLGVYRGLPLREAHAIAPRATFLPSAPQKYQRTLVDVDQLLNTFMGVSEPVWTYPAVVNYLPCDDKRIKLLQQYATMIGQTVREGSGLPSSVGIAPNKFAAYMAAKLTHPNHLRVVDDHPATFLAPIHLHHLSIETVLRERLALFGIATLGQFADLPASAVREQFGTKGAALHQLANGVDHRAVVNPPREVTAYEQYEFDDPIYDRQQLERSIGRISHKLHEQLRAYHRAVQLIRLHLELEDRTILTPSAGLKQPTQDADVLQRQINALLSRLSIHAGVLGVTLTYARLIPVEVQQLSLFDFTTVTKREGLDKAIEKLTERFESRLFLYGTPMQLESRLPERRWKWKKVAGSKNTAFHQTKTDQIFPRLDTDEAFAAFRWRGEWHNITQLTKAWHIEQAWWEQQAARDYYKVRTDTGWLLLICYDGVEDVWKVQQVYD